MCRRINIVPFEHKPKEPDLQLEEKLKAEWTAILRWAIDGCLDWQNHRLTRPRSVVAATGNYFDDENICQQWLDEECDVERGNSYKTATSAALFTSWSTYAKTAGSLPGRRRASARI
jgi:putative DNA primase/helicase